MVFELACHGSFNCPMSGVMNPRRHFIGEEFAIAFEEFDGQNTDIVQGFQDFACRVFCSLLYLWTDAWRGSQGETQDAVAMMILNQRIKGGFTCLAAHGEHGELPCE